MITAQLLFFERTDDATVRLDVVVLDGADDRVGPQRGAALAFDLRLPRDSVYREDVAATLAHWAAGSETVDLNLAEWESVTRVVVMRGREAVLLAEAGPVA